MSRPVYTFSAGPCIFPIQVLQSVQSKLAEFFDASHDAAYYLEVESQCRQMLIDLLEIPCGYSILFTSGGATTQFAAVVQNLLGKKGNSADYLVTGTWSKKAKQECERMGGKVNSLYKWKKVGISLGFLNAASICGGNIEWLMRDSWQSGRYL